jgi:hypothetical protein
MCRTGYGDGVPGWAALGRHLILQLERSVYVGVVTYLELIHLR